MISIIIPARNNAELTELCLSSVDYSISDLGISAQIILIDNNSAPIDGVQNAFACFQKKRPAARILRLTKDLHYTAAFTLGLQHSVHQNILFVSNDMMITPSYITSLLAVAALKDEYGIIRGTSAHTDSHPEHMTTPPFHLSGYDAILHFSKMIAEVNGLHHVEDSVLTGDSVLIKRKVLDVIGVLDTRFYGYFGDIDFGLRAHLAGFKLVCAKGAWLHHEGAGYLRGQVKANEFENISVSHSNRMLLVQAAYNEFRDKWDMSLPPNYSDLKSLHLFEMAKQNAHKIRIKCDIDPSILDYVKYISTYQSS